MKVLNKLVIWCALLLISPFVIAKSDGHPFKVNGEQLDFAPPTGWKLAWMDGDADGAYFAEYIPSNEDINSWRKGYLFIQRQKYPDTEVLKKLKDADVTLPETLRFEVMRMAKINCEGNSTPLPIETKSFNDLRFFIGGGFCDSFGSVMPFGEGALFSFVEGKHYFYKIKYGWRPNSKEELKANRPLGIDPKILTKYSNSFETIHLCGGENQPTCKITYVD